MKHTVKSLLITTILTLPTVFGAQSLPASTPLTDDSAQEPSSSICVAADTKDAMSKSTLKGMPIGLVLLITGWQEPNFTAGYLDVRDLARLALTAKCWNNVAQPMLSWINNWGKTTAIPRLLENNPQDLQATDKQALALLRIKADIPANTPTDAAFITRLNITVAVQSWKASMTSDELAALVTVIDNTTLTSNQKNILKWLSPYATCDNIRWAAYSLRALGPQYHDKAAELYEKAANHQSATPAYISSSADELIALGPKYNYKASELYEKAANHQNLAPNNIRCIAQKLSSLGPNYTYKAAELHVKAVTREEASPGALRSAARGLRDLGPTYRPKAAEFYVKAARCPDATCFDILRAADGLRALGPQHHDKAAEFYKKSTDHQNAISPDIRWATDGLKALGSTYPEDSEQRKKYNRMAVEILRTRGLSK